MSAEPFTDQLTERLRDARMFYRRGYSLIDAAANAGLHADVLDRHLTADDHKVHDAVWSA